MDGCHLCPQMEKIFGNMQNKGSIDALDIINLAHQPELARQMNIRSVPYYFIDGVGFGGLKSEQEIEQILNQDTQKNWQQLIVEELSSGQLEAAETLIRQHAAAREAMLELLGNEQTTLVVRIGLSAVIESLAADGLLDDQEPVFRKLASSANPAIAQDALYYLSLLDSPTSLKTLQDIAQDRQHPLYSQAGEILQEMLDDQVVH